MIKVSYRTILELNIPYAHRKKTLSISLRKYRKEIQKEYKLSLISTHSSSTDETEEQDWAKSITIWRSYRREKIEDLIYGLRLEKYGEKL